MSDRAIRTQPLPGPFGAEVLDYDARRPPSAEIAAALISEWEHHSLLLFRNQTLEPPQQVSFGSLFGEVVRDQYGRDGWTYISNMEGGYLPRGELVLHSDHAMAPTMPEGTILYGVDVPPPGSGGETLFADCKLAYRLLPETLRRRIRGLKVRHSRRHSEVERLTPAGVQTSDAGADDLRQFDRPLALRHPRTGAELLFLCPRFAPQIVGVSAAESDALVAELVSYLERPEVSYSHEWRRGDVLLWDNIALQHARNDWDPRIRRHLCRVIFGQAAATEAVA